MPYLHLPEHVSERLAGRLHERRVEGPAHRQRAAAGEVEPPGVLLQEVQRLGGKHTATETVLRRSPQPVSDMMANRINVSLCC